MKLIKHVVVFLALTVALLPACSRDRAESRARTYVPPMDTRSDAETPIDRIPVIEETLLSSERTACEELRALAKLLPANGTRFSTFRALDARGRGRIDLGHSPFTQLILGEKFEVDTPEAFYEKARAEREAGRLSWIKWQALGAARLIPSLFRSLQIDATNEKLAEKFPGIFYGDAEADAVRNARASLAFALALKSARTLQPSLGADALLRPSLYRSILTAELPLFEQDGTTPMGLRTRATLAAAIRGLYTENKISERLCGGVLLQRSFAQLLTFKGYRSPKLYARKSGKTHPARSWTRRLTTDDERFASFERGGVFVDPTTSKRIMLTPEAIQSYASSLRVSHPYVPAVDRGTLSETLSVLESLVYHFEATLPSAKWVKTPADYALGDIQSEKHVRAILPPDAHKLALGLIGMSFKNVASHHIRKVNTHGRLLEKGEKAAGILLMDSSPGSVGVPIVRLRLRDVATLARVATRLEVALETLATRGDSDRGTRWSRWFEMNDVYDRKTLAKLVGARMFSQRELNELLTREEQEGVLLSKLAELRLPLAMLLLKFTAPPTNERDIPLCGSALLWNPSTGDQALQAPCTSVDRREMAESLELLASRAQSAVLLRQARRILLGTGIANSE